MTEPYDIVVASRYANYDFFAHKMRELCGQWSLSFFMVDDVWVKEFYQKLLSREISVRALFDLTNEQVDENDIYLKVSREAKRQGAHVIDDPDLTAIVAHKGHCHKLLVENRILVPETIIVNRSELDSFKITDEIKARLGTPFVVKPAWGWGGAGVILDAHSKDDLHQCADLSPDSDAFLLQQRLRMKQLGRHAGWFRTFHIFGDVIACWWDPASHEYHLVRPEQVRRYKLAPLKRMARNIARASKMKKFSSEICLHDDGKFYAVDYVNADPDMNPRSFYDNGVPDEVVRHIVWLLFYQAMRLAKKGQGFFDEDLNDSQADADRIEQWQLAQRGQAK